MRYHNISKDDMLNGEGLRTVLWVSGCNHYCKGCQNPSTWDPNDGVLFDEEAKKELWNYIDEDYCSGLTLSGGDPMYPENRDAIYCLCKEFRDRYGWGEKTIWMYTGYSIHELGGIPALNYIDVIVDGPFEEDKKNIKYMWAGSENQGIWRRVKGFGDFRFWMRDPPAWSYDIEDKNQKGDCGCGF